MPSPIAHVTAGYLIYRSGRANVDVQPSACRRSLVLLLAAVFLSMLPDADWALALYTSDYGRFHNNESHSLFTGFVIALAVGLVMAFSFGWRQFRRWLGIALVAYEGHVLLDYFTVGRGVMLFWPLTRERFSAPFKLFYGFHWSDGWLSWKHLTTALSEGALMLLVLVAIRVWERRHLEFSSDCKAKTSTAGGRAVGPTAEPHFEEGSPTARGRRSGCPTARGR